jgi:hypothetical protein
MIIDDDPTAGVMGCWHNGYRLLRHVDPVLSTDPAYIRKSLENKLSRLMADIEVNTLEILLGQFVGNRPRDNISRRKLCPGIVTRHESGSVR